MKYYGFVLVWTLLLGVVSTSTIDSKIYYQITNFNPCILLTNATHQVGCTSDKDGNHGVIHLISNDSDKDWLINEGPHAPYVPLLDYHMFTETVMSDLMKSKKISGVLVKHTNVTDPDWKFSPDPKCPLDKFGKYSNSKEYGHCAKVEWNPIGNGMSMVYYGVPIFLIKLKHDLDEIEKCFNKYNKPNMGKAQGYPLCSIELRDFMFAAKDTPTCRRKSEMANPIQSTYCDPLGDNNVFASLYPIVGQLGEDEVIMASARLDSAAFFHFLSPAADNGVTSIVTLLAAAKALGDYKRSLLEKNITENLRPILFTLFNGEVWDYIGSSRAVWDMERGVFPYQKKNPFLNRTNNVTDDMFTSKINLSNIGYFMEISQIGQGKNGKFYVHTDPLSQEEDAVKNKVTEMLDALKNASNLTKANYEVVDRSKNMPLPPASFHRFLRQRNISGFVLADHENKFTNKFYNSRFDDAEYAGFTRINESTNRLNDSVAEQLSKISETVANTLYLLASNGVPPKEKLTVHPQLVAGLMYCLLMSSKCNEFKKILDKKNSILPDDPMPRYVNVNEMDNAITRFMRRLLAYYTGEFLPEAECKGKNSATLPYAQSYMVVKGATNESVCVKSSSYLTLALSPAFELKDFESTVYSTWMESMWSAEMGIRIYLVANPKVEWMVLGAGLFVLIASFVIVYFANKKASVLFTPNILVVES